MASLAVRTRRTSLPTSTSAPWHQRFRAAWSGATASRSSPTTTQSTRPTRNTGRIEVTVIDTSSADALECLSGSQIQATALAINSLLNPNINTVVYHVSVHEDANGKFQKSAALGLIKPTGDIKSFVTFTWTKNLADTNNGFSWSCTISGIDSDLAAKIKSQISNSSTTIISTTTAATTSAASTDAATTAATASAQ